MNTVVTSRSAILAACSEFASREGLGAVNIRAVAEKCGVSVGSVYNYFSSKADLVSAVIEDIWRGIFREENTVGITSFPELVTHIYAVAKAGAAQYPDFFTAHSVSLTRAEKPRGRDVMECYFKHLKAELLKTLEHDANVRPTAFTPVFTRERFVDFVFQSLIAALSGQGSCEVLEEVIKRVLY